MAVSCIDFEIKRKLVEKRHFYTPPLLFNLHYHLDPLDFPNILIQTAHVPELLAVQNIDEKFNPVNIQHK